MLRKNSLLSGDKLKSSDLGIAKIGIIGSGAITEESYIPASKKVSNAVVSHLVDIDIKRAQQVAERFNIPNYTDDYRKIYREVNAVVIATPPKSHSAISIDCMKNGLHVLCEKPLASSFQEAEEMVATSKKSDVILAVGMVRRLSWGTQLLEKLIRQGFLGKITHVDVEEGWEFSWPLRTGHIFESRHSGVISDAGSHLIDLVLWILGSRDAEVDECTDDNLGGIEANADIKLTINANNEAVSATIKLSFTRKLRNTIKIEGDRGCLEADTAWPNEIRFTLEGSEDTPVILTPMNKIPKIKNQEFVVQLKNFTDAVISGANNFVPAEDVLTTMRLIEDCYQKRRATAQKWVAIHLEKFFGGMQSE